MLRVSSLLRLPSFVKARFSKGNATLQSTPREGRDVSPIQGSSGLLLILILQLIDEQFARGITIDEQIAGCAIIADEHDRNATHRAGFTDKELRHGLTSLRFVELM